MTDIWRRNRDRRRARAAQRVMQFGENAWRSEVERLRKEIAELKLKNGFLRGKASAQDRSFEDRWDNE